MTEARVFGKLGRLPAQRPDGLHLLSYYQTNPLPTAPASVTVPTPASGWGMYGNDTYGDCTCAGAVHCDICIAAVLKLSSFTPPTSQTVTSEYLHLTGGQDTGLVEATLLQDWQQSSIFGTGQLAAYAPTDVSDFQELQSVIASYGVSYIGVDLPAPAQTQFRIHKPWDLTGTPADQNILGGHCVVLVGYDANYYYCITWGAVQAITQEWLQSYMEEAWAIITPEIVSNGSYGDLRLQDLINDIEGLSSK